MAYDASRVQDAGEQTSILIVGTGFAGLGMAIALQKAGIDDFIILERAEGVGGTWRDNHYPGCACDVQSHLYSFSFEANPNWSRMFARQPEIRAYLEGCADKHGLLRKIRFGAEVTEARYDEARQRWDVTTAQGARYGGNVLVSGMGGLSTPAYPQIKGLSRFKGKVFHSAEWDHDYDLNGKRVAVIGTGASAIQFVPQIQKQVTHLDLYQRTPPWIMPKPDREIGNTERKLYQRLPLAQRAYRLALYWVLEARVMGFVINPKIMKLAERQARAHLRRKVADPVLRAKLTPDFTFGCKRVLISDDYFPALTQPNVEVVTDGIREVTADGVVAIDGQARSVDCIIYGTGFKAQDPLPKGMIFGRDGQDLIDAWPQGPEAYKGSTIAGFPNLFMLMGPNTGLGHSSMVFIIESQIAYVLDAVKQMRAKGWGAVDVRPEHQTAYNDGLQQKLKKAIWTAGGCMSWYVNESGRNTTLWPGFTFHFRRLLRRFDAGNYRVEQLRTETHKVAA